MSLSDSKQRLQALDPTQSFIVQAPAGSGKTELLTLRYMKLLSKVREPEEVLAITFTRKAASEMRDRIVKSLQQALQFREQYSLAELLKTDDSNPIEDELKRQNFAIANEVIEADLRENWNLEQHPSRLRIQTIDSFNIYLANQLPIASRIGGDLSVTTEVETLFKAAIHSTLSLLDHDHGSPVNPIAQLFSHLDNNVQRIETMLLSMLHRRDQWLSFIPKLVHDSDVSKAYFSFCIDELVTEALTELTQSLSSYASSIIEFNNYASENWLKDKEGKPELLSELPACNSEDLAKWLQLKNLLLTKSNDWRKKVTKNDGFPSKSDAPKERKAFVAERIDSLKSLIAEISESANGEYILLSLKQLELLPSQKTLDTQWPLLSALAQTLRLLHQQLIMEFTNRGVIDHVQASNAALNALESYGGPTELALALDNKLSHILVDEFQDTSERQLTLLTHLTAEWSPADGRTLFLVGDAMQSCYNFRNANVGTYLHARAHGIGDLSLTPLILDANFRSQESLVALINKIFSLSFPKQENISRGAVTYSPSVSRKPDQFDQAVSATWVSYEKSEEKDAAKLLEAKLVTERITELRSLQPNCSIAILARNRNHFASIIAELKEANINWLATDIDRLSSLSVIDDLLTLVKAVLNTADRIAWLALLRSPWCGLISADLLAITALDYNASIWHNLQQVSSLENTSSLDLSADTIQRVNGLVAALHFAMATRFKHPLRDVIECAWALLGGNTLIQNMAESDSVDFFFSQLEKYENNYAIDDIDDFESAITKSFVPSESGEDESGNDAIHLMTIHKSKGLQYDHVIIPQLAGVGSSDPKNLIELHERLNRDGEPRLFIAALAQKGDQNADETLYNFIRNENYHKNYNEQTRLVYIAMTRARFSVSLYATMTKKSTSDEGSSDLSPPAQSLLARIWPALSNIEGIAQRIIPIQPTNRPELDPSNEAKFTPIRRLRNPIAIDKVQQSLIQAQLEYLEEQASADEELESDTDRLLLQTMGTLSHSLLEAYCTAPFDVDSAIERVRPRWRRQLERLGASSEVSQLLTSRASQELLDSLKGPHAWIFDKNNEDAHSELKLARNAQRDSEEFHEHFIVDRSFIHEGTRWIIDFKTSHAPSGISNEAFIEQQITEYRPQLERYAELFRGFESKPQTLALFLVSTNELIILR